jgi:N-methylhydantoinase A/oxoprolinase/acetone carboxylase beta subunit
VLAKGYSPLDYSLFCYGGGGPLHVAGYTEGAGYADVLVPTWAAGFSAYGCACGDFSYRFDQTAGIAIASDDPAGTAAKLDEVWGKLKERALGAFASSGIGAEKVELRYLANMQYSGQLNDIEVTANADNPTDTSALIAGFEDLYGRLYASGAASPELGYTITSLALVGSSDVAKPVLPDEEETDQPAVPKGERPVWWTQTEVHVPTPVYEQDDVRAGQIIVGPAIIEAPATTFAIPPGREARLDRHRIFHLSNVTN